MTESVVLLSIPGLRREDLSSMPNLSRLGSGGQVSLVPSFPCVTCPVQANMTTGRLPRDHGVIANGFYYRDKRQVEMWTAWNDCIDAPQIWDLLHQHDASLTSAVWFPLHSKGCEADYVCTPAPIHNPDGSESLWCYTRPMELYGELRDELGHFPLMHFWGPLANIKSTDWIARSAVAAAKRWQPRFTYVYLPHLDYAAQKSGPDSPAAQTALADLDRVIGEMEAGFTAAYQAGPDRLLWLVASEYTILPVNHVVYPNRVLREAGLLAVREEGGRELLDFETSRAWAMVDHQLAHLFVPGGDGATLDRVRALFQGQQGIAEVLIGDQRSRYEMDHERSGEAVLVSTPNSWLAYPWWLDDARAPTFARTVDIHRKPGYDPVELFFDPATKGIPLDAGLVRGSHGAPAVEERQRGVLLSSQPGVLAGRSLADTDVFDIVLKRFGV